MISNREKITFAEAMKIDLNVVKGMRGKVRPEDYEEAFSKNSLHQDLGYLKKDFPQDYDLDDVTRDRLIAHARQDIVLAYVAIIHTRKELRGLRSIVWFLGLCNLVLLAILVLK